MDHSKILDQLDAVFIDVLDNKDIKLKYSTTAADVEDWTRLPAESGVFGVVESVRAMVGFGGERFGMKSVELRKGLEYKNC